MVGGNQRTLQILSIYNFFLEGNIYPQSKSCRLSLAFPFLLLFRRTSCFCFQRVKPGMESVRRYARHITEGGI
jgi:hypothetical protein